MHEFRTIYKSNFKIERDDLIVFFLNLYSSTFIFFVNEIYLSSVQKIELIVCLVFDNCLINRREP